MGAEKAKGALDMSNISWSLTGLMDQIKTWLTDFMDKIKGIFWMEQKEKKGAEEEIIEALEELEKENIIKLTTDQLKALKEGIVIDSKLSDNEKKIIEGLKDDHDHIKEYFDWLDKTFEWEDNIILKEKENMLDDIKSDEGKITKKDLEKIMEKETSIMELEWEKKLIQIIKDVGWVYSIEEIQEAYSSLDTTKQTFFNCQ